MSIQRTDQFRSWKITLTDLIVISICTFGVQLIWPVAGSVVLNGLGLSGSVIAAYTSISAIIIIVWAAALWQFGAWNTSLIGSGTREYVQVARASFATFVLVALFSYLYKAEIARGYVLISLPLGLLCMLIGRWVWKKYLFRQRHLGRFMHDAVVVGSLLSADEITQQLQKHHELGLRVVGAFLSQHTAPLSQSQQLTLSKTGVPIWGGIDDLISITRKRKVDSIVIGSTDHLSPRDVQKLGWELLPTRERLYLAANITDVAGPRLNIQPVEGLPLIEVKAPQFTGFNRILKRWLDIIFAIVAIVLTLPFVLIAAISIKLHDRGPVLFVQERIGQSGASFRMFKFRTMQQNAESQVDRLEEIEHDSAGNTVLFKLKEDPRVTKPGKWIRRYSIDELPQLINVLIGNMSLVGPRPPLQREVEKYESFVLSRFIVKPGITGLWQVSGRSDLSWEESVRADLNYVQNWSIVFDLVIMWRTVKAVLKGNGAY